MSNSKIARFSTCLVTFLITAGWATEVMSQRPFEKFGKALDDLRPRGELIKKIFGEDDPREANKSAQGMPESNGDQQRAESLWRQQQQQMQQRMQQAQNLIPGYRQPQLQEPGVPPRNAMQQGRNSAPNSRNNPNWQPERPGSANAAFNRSNNPNLQNQPGSQNRANSTGTRPSYYVPSPQDQLTRKQTSRPPVQSNPIAPPAQFAPVPEPPRPGNSDFVIRSVQAPVNAAPDTIEVPAPRNNVNHGIVVEAEGSEEAPIGLRVRNIVPGGLCAGSNLKRGDVIINIGGVPIAQEGEFQGIMNVLQQGDEMEFTVIRNGKEQRIMVQFGEPAAGNQPDLQFTPGETGGTIGDQSPEMTSRSSFHSPGALKSVLDRTPMSLGMGERNATR
jgi:PDZ domain